MTSQCSNLGVMMHVPVSPKPETDIYPKLKTDVYPKLKKGNISKT